MMKKNTTTRSYSTVYAQQIMAVLSSVAKAKSILMAIRSKTEAMRARLLVCSLLRNVKKPSPPVSLSHKIHSLLKAKDKRTAGHHHDEDHPAVNQLRQATSSSSIGDLGYSRCCYQAFDDDDDGTVLTDNADDSYPDRYQVLPDHSLFDEDHELDQLMVVLQQGGDRDPNASVVDLVRNSKEDVGENFSLEAEIDHVADLFIMKFHRKMRMQKLDSFKRYQRMLERSAS